MPAAAQAPNPSGRIFGSLHDQLGLLPAPHVRRHESPGPSIQHPLDVLLIVPGDADHGSHGEAADGLEHSGHRMQADRTMLGVDHEPVEAEGRDGLGRDRIAEVQPRSHHDFAFLELPLDRILEHRCFLRPEISKQKRPHPSRQGRSRKAG